MLLRNYLLKSRIPTGFTLIELLVVIIIVGVLAAIALPSFLNQTKKAREAEAKTYIGSVNRAQQAFYHENLQFANNLETLALGIPAQTGSYQYQVTAPQVNAESVVIAQPLDSKYQLKVYRGCVVVVNEVSGPAMKSGGPTAIDPANPIDECATLAGGLAPPSAGGGGAPP